MVSPYLPRGHRCQDRRVNLISKFVQAQVSQHEGGTEKHGHWIGGILAFNILGHMTGSLHNLDSMGEWREGDGPDVNIISSVQAQI